MLPEGFKISQGLWVNYNIHPQRLSHRPKLSIRHQFIRSSNSIEGSPVESLPPDFECSSNRHQVSSPSLLGSLNGTRAVVCSLDSAFVYGM